MGPDPSLVSLKPELQGHLAKGRFSEQSSSVVLSGETSTAHGVNTAEQPPPLMALRERAPTVACPSPDSSSKRWSESRGFQAAPDPSKPPQKGAGRYCWTRALCIDCIRGVCRPVLPSLVWLKRLRGG
ncbi:hypothetical protein FQA47_020481 [Oryzias melastigma]|uniref:Uncharacterized protein n=1 Tax=Oryzias melastigma TaxID=30732 RepID=A0A834CEY5_ORYME|nr:hypothetical protein FQA47_020481 [Oryzias melastigma]